MMKQAELDKLWIASHLLPDPGGEVARDLITEIKRLNKIIDNNLEHSADGILLCEYNGPLYCLNCGEMVRYEFDLCYCDSCPNPDSGDEPPLPLFYSQCLTKGKNECP